MSIGQVRPKVMSWIAGIFLAAFLFSTFPVRAETPALTDPVQMVVAKQLSAFRDRNSTEAYAALSSAFQGKYKSPLRFATMMRLNFWELYNHASYRFLGRSHAGGFEIQKVEVKGEDDQSYVFLFRLVRSAAGDWQIDNVLMLDPDGQQI